MTGNRIMANRGHTAKSQPRSEHRWIPLHGLSQAIEGRTWNAIMSRCFNKKCKSYELYGARGITVCPFLRCSPQNFISLVGKRPSRQHSIDRIDNAGNYSCGKCPICRTNGWSMNLRWATRKQQCNNKSDNRLVTIGCRTQTVTQWADQYGVDRHAIFARLEDGWTGKRLLNPTRKAKLIPINGEFKSVIDWCKQIGICEEAFRKRLRNGVPEHLLTLPAQKPRAFTKLR